MGDGNDGAAAQAQVAGEPQAQGDQAQAAVTAGLQGANVADNGGDAVARAHKDYEAALAERDARIAELEGEIAEAAKTAEGAEALRREMDELRRRGDEERVGFELQIAGARNVKAARALLPDHDGDVEKLRAAEPWLFSAPPAPAPAGATGLPSAGAAGADESTQMSRWRRIAGLPENEE
ncbi:MAG TPA: ELKS/Rab6-interacting/CAST family protein [Rubneribacter badeniensis]|uniref:ELKS/Rab6-interacting/CAST family protein n=1 Tax=Rubneribacter badeniensis TaxID=2070688 RepID=A0A9D2VK69_9ACTN|nr:ELKS/Rab6-interacting/CAST family protein [Rubneribacter badeniensis]